MSDHFEHLTPDEEYEARRRLDRDDAQHGDHPPPHHSGQDDHHGCGCLVAIMLIALAGLGGWLLS